MSFGLVGCVCPSFFSGCSSRLAVGMSRLGCGGSGSPVLLSQLQPHPCTGGSPLCAALAVLVLPVLLCLGPLEHLGECSGGRFSLLAGGQPLLCAELWGALRSSLSNRPLCVFLSFPLYFAGLPFSSFQVFFFFLSLRFLGRVS